MVRTIIVACGLILFIVGVGLFLYPSIATWQATRLDNHQHLSGGGGPIPPCNIASIDVPRVMTDEESKSLHIMFTNPTASESQKQKCETIVSLYTTDFNYSPDTTSRDIVIPETQKSIDVSWDISSKKVGTYQILIKTLTEEQTVGIIVTNVFGWNAYQIQLIGEIVSIATVVAPIAAIVKGISWLFGYLQKKKQVGKEESETTSPQPTAPVKATSAKPTKAVFAQKPRRRTRQK